jgi:poly(A) polymerase
LSVGNGGGAFGSPESLLEVAAQVAVAGALPPPEITEAARAAAPLAAQVSPARQRAGIEAVLMGKALDVGLQWMHDAGLLAVLLPELEATVDFSQEAGRRHKDVWEHTKQVVRQSVPKPAVRWSALLHDIGKVPTRVMLPDGRVTFHRHAEVGARMWDPIGRRLQFDKADRQKIRFLILHHLRANAYEPGWTDAAVRRFDHEMGDNLEELLDLSRAGRGAARRRWATSTRSRSASW